jgi:hypothetical protein
MLEPRSSGSQPPPSELNFDPDSTELGHSELRPIGLDFTNYVISPETIQAVAIVVTNLQRGTDASTMVSGAPTVQGNVVQLFLDGSRGTPGVPYRLEATITKSSGARLSGKLQVVATY